MKLTEKAISKKALEVYAQIIKDRHIPEDMTSDIYYLFIGRMNNYRKRKPDKHEVTDSFVTGAVRYIVRELKRKQQRKENVEKLLFDIKADLYAICDTQDNKESPGKILERLFDFIKVFSLKNRVYKEYVRFFLLYYGVYLPLDFIDEIGEYLGFNSEALRNQVMILRSQAVELCSKKLKTYHLSLGISFFRILDCHQEMNRTDSLSLKVQLLNRLENLEGNRKAVIDKLHDVMIVPRYQKAAFVSGVHIEKFRYGLKLFCLRLKEYFHKDSQPTYKAA